MKTHRKLVSLFMALSLIPTAALADYHDTHVENANGDLGFGRYFWQLSDGSPSGGYEDHYYPETVYESDGVTIHKAAGANALTSWQTYGSGQAKQIEAFVHMPAGRTTLQLAVTARGNVTLEFDVKTADGPPLVSGVTHQLSASAEAQMVNVLDGFDLPADAYYRIIIKVKSGHENISRITHWHLTKASSTLAYLPDYNSSPSVHTNEWKTTHPNAPLGNSYDWAYQEVMIPEESDIVGTYCMSLGVFHGYMGIQNNGDGRHDIIYSMWDNGSTDVDRNLPDYLRSGSLDANVGVAINRFGGEGTGTQAFRKGDYWQPGQWVKFLTHARPEQVTVTKDDGTTICYNNTLVTAWYKTEGGADNVKNAEPGEEEYDGWRYIATHRLSGGNTYLNGWYSFLENYNWPTGNMKRTAYYRNGSLHSLASGEWYHRNVVSCSHTDGGSQPGKRNDYGTGIATIDGEPAFYMTTGGLADSPFAANQTMPYKEGFVPVSPELMDKLLGRVDRAIQKYQATVMTSTIENCRLAHDTGLYSVVAANSEATNEDKTIDGVLVANRKEAAADGNENSYWHTNYGTGNGKRQNAFPYTIDLQVSGEARTNGVGMIELYQSRGDSYRVKSVEVLYSDNNADWASAGTYSVSSSTRPVIVLDNEVRGHSYLRLNIKEGYGAHLVINEIYLKSGMMRDMVNAEVDAILARENQYDGYASADLADLKSKYAQGEWTDFADLKHSLAELASNGRLIKYGSLGEINSISSFKAYTLHNVNGYGDAIVKDGSLTLAGCTKANPQSQTYAQPGDVTLPEDNWLILRSEQWGAFFLYNLGAKKFLSVGSPSQLVDTPTPIYINKVANGFTFRTDLNAANGFLCAAPQLSSPVASWNSTDAGSVWEIRDNYGVTPDADAVKTLLDRVNASAQLVALNTEAQSVLAAPVGAVGGCKSDEAKAALTAVYDAGRCATPQTLRDAIDEARLELSSNAYYHLKSTTGRADGYITDDEGILYHRPLDAAGEQLWFFPENAAGRITMQNAAGRYMTWNRVPVLTTDENEAKTISLVDRGNGQWNIKVDGGQCIDVNATNLTGWSDGVNSRWYIYYVEDLPEEDGTINMSTRTKKYYYTIRNVNRPGDYAHFNGATGNLSLGSAKNASAVFYFTEAAGSTDDVKAVNIHNVTAPNLVMNDWTNWGETPSLTWYISEAAGTRDVEGDFNIRRTATGNDYWNWQSHGVARWSAGTDRGSAWYIERVYPTEFNVVVNGAESAIGGIVLGGETYRNGQNLEAFFANAGDFDALHIEGKTGIVTPYKGTLYVDYVDADPFFSVEGDTPNYYKILFNNSKMTVGVGDAAPGTNIKSVNAADAAAWAFYGTTDAFILCNQQGRYAVLNGDRVTTTTAKASATTFRLVDLGNDLCAIVRPNATGTGFNPWGGMRVGNEIGFYSTGDANTKVVFQRLDGTTVTPTFPVEEYAVTGVQSFDKTNPHTLWYNQPSGNSYAAWQEYSLPIGNGELGGSIFGGVKTDKITLNEKSLWDGASTTRNNGSHGEYLKFGSVWVKDLTHNFEGGVNDYVRWLDIDDAVAGVRYTDAAGTTYTRTAFSSQPDGVMVMRYEADGSNTMDLNFTVVPGGQLSARSATAPEVSYDEGKATFDGRLELLSYAAQVRVVPDEAATMTCGYDGITVRGARTITLYYTGGTDFDAFQQQNGFVNGRAQLLPADMDEIIDAAQHKSYDALLADHVADYHSYYDRTKLDLRTAGAEVASDLNTKDLITRYTNDAAGSAVRNTSDGLFLEQLYYNYGRYLLISSNRGKSVPNNLQGLWIDTDEGHAPWNADIHTNINIQMNYWPAEPNGLGDLHMPLLDHIISIADSPGAIERAQAVNRAAGAADPSVGWVVNTESNLFGGMSWFMSNYTVANAWYVSHLWQHYRYTLDEDFLRRAFPAMWSASQYWAQRLVYNETDGTWECPSEWSPEHGPGSENATAHSQQLVRELFDATLGAIAVLGNEVDLNAKYAGWLDMIRERSANLDSGLHTETYHSGNINGKNWNTLIADGTEILREWKTSPYTVGEPGHRHTSHLMALYPFNQIQPGDPYFEPAVNSLRQRTDQSTGWAMGWRVNLWARAQDGDHARTMINNALRHTGGGGVYYNLWDSHAPFQIDGNFGVCAGISEMLLQSGTGVISLLPALPTAWAEGSIRGLKAVGNFTVDQQWAEGLLTYARIVNNKGQELMVRHKAHGAEDYFDFSTIRVLVDGHDVTSVAAADGAYRIPETREGSVIEFLFDQPALPKEVDITYVYTFNGKVCASETLTSTTRQPFPQPTILPYGVETADGLPVGDVMEEGTYTINCEVAEDYPIEFTDGSSYDEPVLYYLEQNPADPRHHSYWACDYMADAYNVVANTHEVPKDDIDELLNYVWWFEGDPFNGFRIFNFNCYFLDLGSLSSAAVPYVLRPEVVGQESDNLWMITGESRDGIFLQPKGKRGYVNLQGGLLKNWHQADGGSTTKVHRVNLQEDYASNSRQAAFGETTAIGHAVTSPDANNDVYDLSGRRIQTSAKGIVIDNGSKRIDAR